MGFEKKTILGKMFFLKINPWNVWKMFGKYLRTVDPRIETKNQGARIQLKKARPKSQAKSYKKSIQISKQQRGAASGAAQKRGGALKRAAPFLGCCFEIWIDFLKDLAWLFGWLDSLLAYALGWLFPWIFGRQKKNIFEKRPKKHFSKQRTNKNVFFVFLSGSQRFGSQRFRFSTVPL